MKKKILAIMLSLSTLCGTTSVMAADIVETTETGTKLVPVSYTKEPSFKVQVPKSLELTDLQSGQQSVTYEVNVKGNLASNQSVIVSPSSKINVKNSVSLDKAELSVDQSQTEFFANNISGESGETALGTISGNLGVGRWSGQLAFNVSMGVHQHNWVYSENSAVCSTCNAQSVYAVLPASSANDTNFMNSGISKNNIHELYIENAYTAGNVSDTFDVTNDKTVVGWITAYGSSGKNDIHIAPASPEIPLKAPADASYLFAGITEISADSMSLYFGNTTTMAHAFENVNVSGLTLSGFDNVQDFTSAFAGSNINISTVNCSVTDNMYNKNTSNFTSKISMKNIGNGTFAYMPNMGANGEDLDITAETIDGGAFFADGNLQGGSSHTVSDDTIHYSSIILNGVKNITGQAIFSDVQAKNIVFNTKKLSSIPMACFYYNADLISIDIPDDINSGGDFSIEQAAFTGCSSLTSLKLPKKMNNE